MVITRLRCYSFVPYALRSAYFSTSIDKDLKRLTREPSCPVNMKQMQAMAYAITNPQSNEKQRFQALVTTAEFLRKEVPIRVSKIIKILRRFPFGLYHNPEIKGIAKNFEETLTKFSDCSEIKTDKDEKKFLEICKWSLEKHQSLYFDFSKGLAGENLTVDELRMLVPTIDHFHMGRIANRMIISQYIALHGNNEGFYGVIESECDVKKVIEAVYNDIFKLNENNTSYKIPELELTGKAEKIPYVTSHLEYIIYEVLVNSIRAVTQTYRDENDASPPIKAIISDGTDDIVIKISDRGGGMDRSTVENIWTYLYPGQVGEDPEQLIKKIDDSKMDGMEVFGSYGPLLTSVANRYIIGNVGAFAMPICRQYARYFGGDMKIYSMEGYGTDVYIYINKMGTYLEPLTGIVRASGEDGETQSSVKNTWKTTY